MPRVRLTSFYVTLSYLSLGQTMERRGRARHVPLQYLAKPRVVDFDVRLQRGKGDLEVGDPALEQETNVPNVVGPGSPHALHRERGDAIPHAYEPTGDVAHRWPRGRDEAGRDPRSKPFSAEDTLQRWLDRAFRVPRRILVRSLDRPSSDWTTHLTRSGDEDES